MNGLESIALPFLLTAIAFGPITAFVARSRDRQPLIWFFLGVLIGPIALALVKRNVPVDAALTVDDMPAAQEVVVDPEVGLHVRPLR